MDSIVIIIVLGSLTIISLIASVRTVRGSGQYDELLQDGNIRVYKISGWLHLCAYICLCFGFAAVIRALIGLETIPAIFLGGAGLFFFWMGIYGVYRFRRAFVRIGANDLVYSDGRKEVHVELNMIRNVAVANGIIFISAGEKVNISIPIAFRKASEIYSVLNRCVRENSKIL